MLYKRPTFKIFLFFYVKTKTKEYIYVYSIMKYYNTCLQFQKLSYWFKRKGSKDFHFFSLITPESLLFFLLYVLHYSEYTKRFKR